MFDNSLKTKLWDMYVDIAASQGWTDANAAQDVDVEIESTAENGERVKMSFKTSIPVGELNGRAGEDDCVI